MNDITTIPFQTEVALGYFESGGNADVFFANAMRQGQKMLGPIGFDTRSPDLKFLAYLVWRGLTEDRWDDDYLVVGDITDMVSDHEAELLVELEPKLQARVPREGAGGMSPEVTAIHDLLLQASADAVDRWRTRRDEEELAPHLS